MRYQKKKKKRKTRSKISGRCFNRTAAVWCFLRGFVPVPSVHRQDVNVCVNATASALGTSEADKAESQSLLKPDTFMSMVLSYLT